MWVFLLVLLFVALAGCSSTPIIETKVIDRPVPIFCTVDLPSECKDAYAVDRVSTQDSPIVINRSFREEIEERFACEIKLRAALKACNAK